MNIFDEKQKKFRIRKNFCSYAKKKTTNFSKRGNKWIYFKIYSTFSLHGRRILICKGISTNGNIFCSALAKTFFSISSCMNIFGKSPDRKKMILLLLLLLCNLIVIPKKKIILYSHF